MLVSANIIKRFKTKLNWIRFILFHASDLKECGKNTLLYPPFRLDGSDNISIGSDTVIQSGSWVYCCPIDEKVKGLIIGSGCVFGYNNHITAVYDVVIEDNVLTANNVYISDNQHSYENIDIPIMDQPINFKKNVMIGQGSWIGENVSIIGASVGRNCVIGANSVVTHNIPDYSVAVGAPALVIRQFNHTTQKWVNVKN